MAVVARPIGPQVNDPSISIRAGGPGTPLRTPSTVFANEGRRKGRPSTVLMPSLRRPELRPRPDGRFPPGA